MKSRTEIHHGMDVRASSDKFLFRIQKFRHKENHEITASLPYRYPYIHI